MYVEHTAYAAVYPRARVGKMREGFFSDTGDLYRV